MPLQGAKHTTMTDNISIGLCKHHRDNPKLTQTELVTWLQETHNLIVIQGTVSNTLKRKADLLKHDTDEANLNSKRLRAVKYPMMETALVEWFKRHQERVNLSGDLVCEAAQKILDHLYPGHDPFKFSNGWLEAFKKRHGIHSYRRFGESGSVNIDVIADSLPRLRETIDKFEWKDIYNMDELMDNGVVEELVSQIRQFRYLNPMDIDNLLDCPAEQEVAFVPDIDDVVENQLTTGEADDADDDSQEHPKIFPAEAQKMLQTLERFWIQQEADSQEFIISLQRMIDKLSKIRVNQMVQKDICQFFNSS